MLKSLQNRARCFSSLIVFLFVAFLFCHSGAVGCSGTTGSDDEDINDDTDDNDDTSDNDDDTSDDTSNTTACTSITAPDWDSPWPMFHGFETHTGLSTAAGPQSSSSVKTFSASTNAGNPPNSIAIASNGTIYLAGGDKVYSLTLSGNTFTTNWSKSYTGAQGPALSHDETTLYFGRSVNGASQEQSTGFIDALNTSDGSEKWEFPAEGNATNTGGFHFGPTVGPDGTIYQGSWDSNLYALTDNGSSVTKLWSYPTQGSVSYPPSILNCADSSIGELIILGGGDAHNGPDCNIYAINATTGAKVWTYQTQTETLSAAGEADPTDCDVSTTPGEGTSPNRIGSPSISDDGLIYASAGPKLLVFDSEGTLQWKLGTETTENFGIISPALTDDGFVYALNSPGGPAEGQVYKINASTGAAVPAAGNSSSDPWFFQTGTTNDGLPSFFVVDSEGTVYFGDANGTNNANGTIYAVNSSGTEVFNYPMTSGTATQQGSSTVIHGASEAAPALVNGVLYFSSDDGLLYVIGP